MKSVKTKLPRTLADPEIIIIEDLLENLSIRTQTVSKAKMTSTSSSDYLNRGKIPDVVREIPDFYGNPRDLPTWLRDVEDVLELFEDTKETPFYKILLKTIRRKVKGEASEILMTNNVGDSFKDVKATLTLYYADKRDLITLDHQLRKLVKEKNESIESYYARVKEMSTLISATIANDEEYKDHVSIFSKFYGQIALDVFVRGLGEPLSLFCKNYKPETIAQAYSYCLDFTNTNMRNETFFKNQKTPTPSPRSFPLEKPRINQANPTYRPTAYPRFEPQPVRPNFYPKPEFPRVNQDFAPRFPYRTPFPTQNSQSRPEPMEVDPSLRVHQSSNFPSRRGPTPSMQINNPPPKRQAHNTEAVEEYSTTDDCLEAYAAQAEEAQNECAENLEDAPFLEEPFLWEDTSWGKE